MGGSIEDDSTDEAAIEETANLIADVAKESQGEATRWANKKKGEKKKVDDDPDDDPDDESGTKDGKKSKKSNPDDDPVKKELEAMKKELEEMKAEKSKGQRAKEIAAAMEKHKIPAKFRDRLAKSISEDENVDEAVATMKQDFITDGLMTDETEGTKAASEKQVDEAADNLLESITAK
ncbi:MAG: hypothetical protein IJ379_13465 [Lachnospiraceae bacterium]|nr:hypothetical protein [Lachnospiraceae bacterium]